MCLHIRAGLGDSRSRLFPRQRRIAAGLNLRGNQDQAPPGWFILRETAEGEKHPKDCGVSGEQG